MGTIEHSAPLTLFLELEPEKSVSLESAARIALAWNDLIIEIFAIIDPSADVRVELIDAVESSLGLRSIIKAIGKVSEQHPLMAGAISGLLSAFFLKPVNDLADVFWPQVYHVVGEFLNPDPNSDDRKKLLEQAEIAQRANVAARQKGELFAQLERDPAIRGARMSPSHTWKPPLIVPRAEFAERSNSVVVEQEAIERRTVKARERVILLTAKLEPKQLTWRFADLDGEPFSAKMKDADFIGKLASPHTGIELRIGLEMDIEMETKQDLIGGFWVNKERAVTKVFSPLLTPLVPTGSDLFNRQD